MNSHSSVTLSSKIVYENNALRKSYTIIKSQSGVHDTLSLKPPNLIRPEKAIIQYHKKIGCSHIWISLVKLV